MIILVYSKVDRENNQVKRLMLLADIVAEALTALKYLRMVMLK